MEQSVTELIIHGFKNCLTLQHFFLIVVGLAGGIVGGALPGITATMSIALLTPLTLAFNPASGLVFLGAIWCGAIYGGSIAACLFKVPGTPSSVATTFDGYPMTQGGDGDKALVTSLVASVVGGIFGVLCLIFAFAPLAKASVKFSKPEYFWLCVFGLTTISAMASESLTKGLLAGCVGLLIETIGLDPLVAKPRFTFGYLPLIQGIHLVPALIGVFAFSQMLTIVEQPKGAMAEVRKRNNWILISSVLSEMWGKCKGILLRSSILGTFIGILPGAGGPIGSIVAYNEAVRWDKNPQKYGKGAIEGVAASESANNAVIGGSLVPMMGLGIPGCPAAAVIMGGLFAHGLIPGSRLLIDSGDVAYIFITSLIFANLAMLVIGFILLRASVNALKVPTYYVGPMVMVLTVIGSYAFRNSMVDVYVMVGCGLVAYFGSKVGLDPGPMSLGLVLGPIAEEALGVSIMMGQAKEALFSFLFLRPICIVLIILSILSALTPIFLSRRQKRLQDSM